MGHRQTDSKWRKHPRLKRVSVMQKLSKREPETQESYKVPEDQRSRVAEKAGISGAGVGVRPAEGKTNDVEKLPIPECVVAPQPSARPDGQGSRVDETAATGQRQEAQTQAPELPRGETTAVKATTGAGVAGGT